MSGNDENSFHQFRIASGKNRVNVLQRYRFSRSSLRVRFEFVNHHLQSSPGIFRDLIESRHDRIAPAADSSLRIRHRRKRQPRPASHQLPDQRPHGLLVHRRSCHSARRPRQNFWLRLALRRLYRVPRARLLRNPRNPPKSQKCPERSHHQSFANFLFLIRHRIHFPSWISIQRSWHSIPKSTIFWSPAAQAVAFRRNCMSVPESPTIYHFLPEIDFCADTLESSHAYLKPLAAWVKTVGASRIPLVVMKGISRMVAGIRTRDLRKVYTSAPPVAAGTGGFSFGAPKAK